MRSRFSGCSRSHKRISAASVLKAADGVISGSVSGSSAVIGLGDGKPTDPVAGTETETVVSVVWGVAASMGVDVRFVLRFPVEVTSLAVLLVDDTGRLEAGVVATAGCTAGGASTRMVDREAACVPPVRWVGVVSNLG